MKTNPIVEFLRTYGPSASSDSLYDEHVRTAAKQLGVREIRIEAPLVEEVGDILAGKTPTSVILTGTAGDGKTHHIRRIYTEYLDGGLEDWPGEQLVLTTRLKQGRELRVIRDLSEFPSARKTEELGRITRCLLGLDEKTVYLIAANDGQLLEMWRTASQGGEGDSNHSLVYKRLSTMLREELKEHPKLALQVFNLSRRTEPRVVQDVIEALLEHEQWESGCEGCPLQADGPKCPIRLNRDLLLGRPQGANKLFRQRLQDLIEVAAANAQHIPLRQIMTLVVNIVLGDHTDHDTPLLGCETALQRANDGAYRQTNPYDSAIGLNLTEDTRSRYDVFATLHSFGLGAESTNQFDHLLLLDRPKELADRIHSSDPVYGRRIFDTIRSQYLRDPRSRLKLRDFPSAIASQRRRIFFELPDEDQYIDANQRWLLTVFHEGGNYLRFKSAVAGNPDTRSSSETDCIDKTMYEIVRGFNRALTGLMTEDKTDLWLATTIGRTDDPSASIAMTDGIPYGKGMYLFHLTVGYDDGRAVPSLRITAQYPEDSLMGTLPLTPFLFEYLLRVSSGYLPTSFSRQCQQEVKHFAMVVREEIAIKAAHDLTFNQIHVLSLDGDLSIKRKGIGIIST